jgi:hypothetical protein
VLRKAHTDEECNVKFSRCWEVRHAYTYTLSMKGRVGVFLLPFRFRKLGIMGSLIVVGFYTIGSTSSHTQLQTNGVNKLCVT